MENDEFRRIFRMNKETLRSLTNFLNPTTRAYQGGRKQIGPAKMVAIAVSFLGSQSPWNHRELFCYSHGIHSATSNREK